MSYQRQPSQEFKEAVSELGSALRAGFSQFLRALATEIETGRKEAVRDANEGNSVFGLSQVDTTAYTGEEATDKGILDQISRMEDEGGQIINFTAAKARREGYTPNDPA